MENELIPNNSVAIVGNGLSRKNIKLADIQQYIPIYGCNALYREFKPDLLFAIDDVIINEVIQSSFPADRFIVPPLEEQYEPAEWNPYRPRENTGMVAMRYAIKKGFSELHCIGMDFLIDDANLNMGNVYDGSSGYGPHTRASYQDCINRTAYFNWFVDQNPNVNFCIIFPKELFETKQFRIPEKDNLKYFAF